MRKMIVKVFHLNLSRETKTKAMYVMHSSKTEQKEACNPNKRFLR